MGDYTYLKLAYDEMVHGTDNATLLSFDGDEFWIPNSLIGDIDDTKGEVWVADWFVEKEGLEAYIDED